MSLSVGTTAGRLFTVSLVFVLLFSLVTGPAAAQAVQGAAGSVVIEEDETVSSVEALAGSIVIEGTVTGDVSGLAGTIRVTESGRVGGSVAAAAGNVRIDGTVGGDVSAGAGDVRVTETATISGDVAFGGGSILIDGRIDGDVEAGGESVTLGPNAAIGGELRYDAAQFTRDPASTVADGVVNDQNLGSGTPTTMLPSGTAAVYGLLANLVLGVILLLAFPAFSARLAGRVATSPGKTGGVGLLTLLGTPIALVLIAVTIVGIPLAVLGAAAFGLGIWVAVVYGQYAVGAWVLRQTGRDDRWVALVGGLVGFAVLGLLPILGGILELIALLLGLGALMLGLRDSFRSRRQSGPRDRQTTFESDFAQEEGGGTTEGTVDNS